MHRIALFAVLFFSISACVRSVRTRIPRIERVFVRDARAFTFILPEAGALVPKTFFAERFVILTDVPSGGPIWADYVDAPGDFAGEGDTLILHVRAPDDIE